MSCTQTILDALALKLGEEVVAADCQTWILSKRALAASQSLIGVAELLEAMSKEISDLKAAAAARTLPREEEEPPSPIPPPPIPLPPTVTPLLLSQPPLRTLTIEEPSGQPQQQEPPGKEEVEESSIDATTVATSTARRRRNWESFVKERNLQEGHPFRFRARKFVGAAWDILSCSLHFDSAKPLLSYMDGGSAVQKSPTQLSMHIKDKLGGYKPNANYLKRGIKVSDATWKDWQMFTDEGKWYSIDDDYWQDKKFDVVKKAFVEV
jgi:hypothetical protein